MLNIKNYNKIQKKLPRVVNNIDDLRDLFNSEQIELDLLNENIDFLISSAFIHDLKKLKEQGYNIERSLQKWEFIYGINPKRYQSDVERIDTIIAKMKIRETTTKKVIEDICQSFGIKCNFQEEYKKYAFTLELDISKNKITNSLLELIEEVKPAHLQYNIKAHLKHPYYIGATSMIGEIITVLPLPPKDIEIRHKPVVAGTFYTQHEVITVGDISNFE